MPTYANQTSVPIARSRGQIDELLRQWGCDGIRWTDLFDEGRVMLEFVWRRDEGKYVARFANGPTLDHLQSRSQPSLPPRGSP